MRNVPGKEFGNISESLSLKSTLCTVNIGEATYFMTQLNYIELCFFCRLDLEKQELLYTDLLSQNTVERPSNGIPNIHNLYLREIISSEANHKGTSSELKVELSTVF